MYRPECRIDSLVAGFGKVEIRYKNSSKITIDLFKQIYIYKLIDGVCTMSDCVMDICTVIRVEDVSCTCGAYNA